MTTARRDDETIYPSSYRTYQGSRVAGPGLIKQSIWTAIAIPHFQRRGWQLPLGIREIIMLKPPTFGTSQKQIYGKVGTSVVRCVGEYVPRLGKSS